MLPDRSITSTTSIGSGCSAHPVTPEANGHVDRLVHRNRFGETFVSTER
jgi:hypothetical protein